MCVCVCVCVNVCVCVTQRWLRLHADEITKALTGKENVLQTQEAEQQHKCESFV